jgi:hypothetical protein
LIKHLVSGRFIFDIDIGENIMKELIFIVEEAPEGGIQPMPPERQFSPKSITLSISAYRFEIGSIAILKKARNLKSLDST